MKIRAVLCRAVPCRAVLAAALVVGFASAVPAIGADSPSPRPQEPVPASLMARYSAAELEDLQLYAEQNGEPLDEVLRKFDGVSEFTEAAHRLRTQLPDDFVAAAWGDGSGSIVIRPGAARKASAALGRASSFATIEERDVPSERSVGEALLAVSIAFADTADHSFTTSYELAANRIVLTVDAAEPPANPNDAAQLGAAATERAMSAAAEGAGAPVEVIIEYEPYSAPQPEVAWGGRAYGTCTGGFVVKASGVRGISTAHHCKTKPSSYDGAPLGTTTPLADRDVRWTRFTGGTSGNFFQYKSGQYRAVTSAIDPAVGGPVCRFGLASGAFCDTVESNGNCTTYSGWPTWCGLFRTVNEHALPGDSGGPWYYGQRAHGIHSGGQTGAYDQFSGVGSLALLGVTVVTS